MSYYSYSKGKGGSYYGDDYYYSSTGKGVRSATHSTTPSVSYCSLAHKNLTCSSFCLGSSMSRKEKVRGKEKEKARGRAKEKE